MKKLLFASILSVCFLPAIALAAGCCILDSTKTSPDNANCVHQAEASQCQPGQGHPNAFFIDGDSPCTTPIAQSYCSSKPSSEQTGCCIQNTKDSSTYGPSNCASNKKKSECKGALFEVTNPNCNADPSVNRFCIKNTTSNFSTAESAATTCQNTVRESASGGFLGFKGSIVPCGRQCDDPQTSINESQSCTLCHLLIMGKRIYEFVLSLLVPVAILFITIGGVIYMLSGPNITNAATGKKIITQTLIGFGVFLLGWLIIFTILKFLAVEKSDGKSLIGQGGKWYEFNCDTNSVFDK